MVLNFSVECVKCIAQSSPSSLKHRDGGRGHHDCLLNKFSLFHHNRYTNHYINILKVSEMERINDESTINEVTYVNCKETIVMFGNKDSLYSLSRISSSS